MNWLHLMERYEELTINIPVTSCCHGQLFKSQAIQAMEFCFNHCLMTWIKYYQKDEADKIWCVLGHKHAITKFEI